MAAGRGRCPLSERPHDRYVDFCPIDDPDWNYDQREGELRRVLKNYTSQSHIRISAHEVARTERRTDERSRKYGPHYWVGKFRYQHDGYVVQLQ